MPSRHGPRSPPPHALPKWVGGGVEAMGRPTSRWGRDRPSRRWSQSGCCWDSQWTRRPHRVPPLCHPRATAIGDGWFPGASRSSDGREWPVSVAGLFRGRRRPLYAGVRNQSRVLIGGMGGAWMAPGLPKSSRGHVKDLSVLSLV
ncbi:hypothetical protein Taro_003467 [Colocasia esculenta]|uniref:Uncharacterized protein n=1 Tax=Colocasia esculenta TaxID=4460 RepID=A0A843TNR1_COLES|nr:hypothetical protein [Colocasia esculenta]